MVARGKKWYTMIVQLQRQAKCTFYPGVRGAIKPERCRGGAGEKNVTRLVKTERRTERKRRRRKKRGEPRRRRRLWAHPSMKNKSDSPESKVSTRHEDVSVQRCFSHTLALTPPLSS